MPPALAVRGLAKRYGRVQALNGVDLEVAEGELVGLLGPNGAGKSTLVKIACGLVRPTAGRPRSRARAPARPTARAALGYLAEFFRFPGWMTADELLHLHQRLAGSDGGKAERERLLELVALADARDRHVEEMSKGMQQRLGIAQALVGAPSCCCSTSRRARSIRSAAAPSGCCSRRCAPAASPSCSTRTCSARSSSSATAS